MSVFENSISEENSFILFLVGIALFFCGCASSPLSRYPDFVSKKNQSTSGLIMTDAVIVDEIPGDTGKVDLVENSKIARMCLNVLAGRLNEKGYHIDRSLVSSLGLVMNSNDVYKIVENENEKDEDIHSLGVASPPFYINNFIFSDSTVRQQLLTLYIRLLYIDHKKKYEPAIQIPEAAVIGKRLGGGLIFVLFVTGSNVPLSVRNGTEEANEGMASTKIAVEQISQVSTLLYILDGETGEVVWDDRVIRQGGIVHQEKLFEMLNKLLDELP